MYKALLVAWRRWDDWALAQREIQHKASPLDGLGQTIVFETLIADVATANQVPGNVLRERLAAGLRAHTSAGRRSVAVGTSGRAWALAAALGHT